MWGRGWLRVDVIGGMGRGFSRRRRVGYTMNLADALGQSVEVLNTQYIVIDGMTVYIVRLSMPVGLVDDFWQPYAAAVERFRVGEGEWGQRT